MLLRPGGPGGGSHARGQGGVPSCWLATVATPRILSDLARFAEDTHEVSPRGSSRESTRACDPTGSSSSLPVGDFRPCGSGRRLRGRPLATARRGSPVKASLISTDDVPAPCQESGAQTDTYLRSGALGDHPRAAALPEQPES